jgi:hypothetical protein
MRAAIGSISGVIYRGEAPTDFWEDRPTFAFVPDEANEPWSQDVYAQMQWPERNAVGNTHTLGSEIWPNLQRAASDEDMARPEGKHFHEFLLNYMALEQAPEASAPLS